MFNYLVCAMFILCLVSVLMRLRRQRTVCDAAASAKPIYAHNALTTTTMMMMIIMHRGMLLMLLLPKLIYQIAHLQSYVSRYDTMLGPVCIILSSIYDI